MSKLIKERTAGRANPSDSAIYNALKELVKEGKLQMEESKEIVGDDAVTREMYYIS